MSDAISNHAHPSSRRTPEPVARVQAMRPGFRRGDAPFTTTTAGA